MDIFREDLNDDLWLLEDDLIAGRVYMTTGGEDDNLDGAYYLYTTDGTLVQLEDGHVERPCDHWKFVEVGATVHVRL